MDFICITKDICQHTLMRDNMEIFSVFVEHNLCLLFRFSFIFVAILPYCKNSTVTLL